MYDVRYEMCDVRYAMCDVLLSIADFENPENITFLYALALFFDSIGFIIKYFEMPAIFHL